MRYSERKPQRPLSSFVECFWTLESDVPSTQPERILPYGCVELILNFGAQFSQHDDDKHRLQPRSFLVGQMTGPILISPTGPVQLLGIRFQPGGTLPFLRLPLHEITDHVWIRRSVEQTRARVTRRHFSIAVVDRKGHCR